MENTIVIKPTFDAKSVFWASILVTKSSRWLIYFIVLFSVLFFNVMIDTGSTNKASWMPLLIAFPFVIAWILYNTYRRSKKQVSDNPKIREDITYTLNDEYFFEKGESFEIKYFWKDVFQVVEKNDFFLIYIRKNVAKIIKKTDLKNNQYNELKALFNTLPIKKRLK